MVITVPLELALTSGSVSNLLANAEAIAVALSDPVTET